MKLCDDHTIRCTLYQPCIVLYAQNRTSHTYWYQVWCIFPNLKLANYKLITLFFRCELDLEPPIHCEWVHFCWPVLIAALLIICITLNKATLSNNWFTFPSSFKPQSMTSTLLLCSHTIRQKSLTVDSIGPCVAMNAFLCLYPYHQPGGETAVSEIIEQTSLTSM